MPPLHPPVRSRRATRLRRRATRCATSLLVVAASASVAATSAAAASTPLPSSDLGVVARPFLAPWSGSDLYWFQDSIVDPTNGDLLLTVSGAERGGNLLRVPRGASEPSGAIQLAAEAPGAIAIAPDGTIYVAHISGGAGGKLSVITPGASYDAGHRPPTVTVGNTPVGVAIAANGTVYVANYADDTVSVIAPGANLADRPPTIAVGERPTDVAIAPDGRILVTDEADGDVSVIDPNAPLNASPSRITVGAGPSSIAIDGPRKRAYVTNDGDHTLSTIDLSPSVGRAARTAGAARRTRPAVPSVPILPEPTTDDPRAKNDHLRDVEVDRDGTVYVAYEREDPAPAPGMSSNGSLLVVDPTVAYDRSHLPREITTGLYPFSLAIDTRENAGTIYVPNAGNGTVSVIDQATITLDAEGELDAHVTRRDGLPTGGDVVFTTATAPSDEPLAVVPVDAGGHAIAPATLPTGTTVTATYRPRGDKAASLLAVSADYAPTPDPVVPNPPGGPTVVPTPAPAPTPAPVPAPAPAPAPSPAERADLGSRQIRRIETVLAGHAAIRVRCPERCQLRGNLTVSRATAKRLGLRSRIIGTVRGDGTGWIEARVRLSPSAVRALRRAPRSVQATIRISGAAKGHTVGFRIKADPQPPSRS